jgi:hypothetical protein
MFGKAFKATFGVGCALVVAIILIVAIGGALGSRAIPSSGPTTAPLGATQAPAAGQAKTWVAVKEWNGSGIKDTEKFTVGNEWRVDWDFMPGQFGGIIQVYIYDEANNLVGLAANTQKAGPDTSFQHKGGTFYLKINASGDWKVGVQDMR